MSTHEFITPRGVIEVTSTQIPGVWLTKEKTLSGGYCPLVEVEIIGDGTCCRFWCPSCQKFHIHGAGFGHAVAHCQVVKGSIFKETGYILQLVDKIPPPDRRFPVKKTKDGDRIATCPASVLNERA